jgi:hypothetical protein
MIGFRQADPRYPFLWSDPSQPAARWHADGEGPAHYFADTPDGAWAELLRHEEIHDPADVVTIRRALWAVELGDEPASAPSTALVPGGAAGHEVVDALERPSKPRDGRVFVIFGEPAGLVGWKAVDQGSPPAGLIARVRHFE